MFRKIIPDEIPQIYPFSSPPASGRSPLDTLPERQMPVEQKISLTVDEVIKLMTGETLEKLRVDLTPEQLEGLIVQINAGSESAQLFIQSIESQKIPPETADAAVDHYIQWAQQQKPHYERSLQGNPKRRQRAIEKHYAERTAGSFQYIEWLRQNMDDEGFQPARQNILFMDAIQLLVEADELSKHNNRLMTTQECATIVGLCTQILIDTDDQEVQNLLNQVKALLPEDEPIHESFEARRSGILAEVFVARYLEELAAEWGNEPDFSFSWEKTEGTEDANGVDFVIRATSTGKRILVDVKSFARPEVITSTSEDGIITHKGSYDRGERIDERYSIPGGLKRQLRAGTVGMSIRVPHDVFLPERISQEEQQQFKDLLKGKIQHIISQG